MKNQDKAAEAAGRTKMGNLASMVPEGRGRASTEAAKSFVENAVAPEGTVTQGRLRKFYDAKKFVEGEKALLLEALKSGATVEAGDMQAEKVVERKRDTDFRGLAVKLAQSLIERGLMPDHKDAEGFVKSYVQEQPVKTYERMTIWS